MSTTDKSNIKWRTIIALIIMYAASFMEWEWMWGVLFLFWVIPDLFSGSTYFIEPIERRTDPALYWIIVITWLFFAVYSLSSMFFPSLSA